MEALKLAESERLALLAPPSGKIRAVIDTDTYNEIDDQFAVAYALAATDRIDVEAIYAAPFWNSRSTGPADGMEKSYQEIERILSRLGLSAAELSHRGSESYLSAPDKPVQSAAAEDLVRRAHKGTSPLYVLALGAITNVASAVLLDPSIRSKIVVVWLGGHPHTWPTANEFNLKQDYYASSVMFDSGVPLVQLPCAGVASHLITTLAELEKDLGRTNDVSNFLIDRFAEYASDHFGWGKVIWDISAVAWVVNASWIPTWLVHSPWLSSDLRWSFDAGRHFIRVANHVDRNAVFQDLFRRVRAL